MPNPQDTDFGSPRPVVLSTMRHAGPGSQGGLRQLPRLRLLPMRIAPLRVSSPTRRWTELMYRARRPVETLLTASLRGVARRQPEAFERLGPVRHATIRISPADLPVAFEMRPDGVAGSIRVVRPDSDDGAASARISGPLLTLLALFDGRGDADGAFFQRRIDIDGDTAAILAFVARCVAD